MRETVKLLLKQGIGGIAKPIVKVGDFVKKGSLIGIPEGLGSNLHSSVYGKIIDITESYILIEADENQPDEFVKFPEGDNIAEMVKASGLIGMGGAGFPTHIKLGTDLNGGVILANGVECEPLLKHNIKQITENPQIVYNGILYAMKATNAKKGILAIKSKNSQAIKAFKSIIKPEDNIGVAELADMYPMGEERAIIREVLGKLLGTDQLPSAANAVVLNVETLSRITEAVEQQKPVISKNVTVAGKLKRGKESQAFFNVPIGTSVSKLIEMAGGIDGGYGEIIMGGPFTGVSTTLDAPITKATGGIIVTMEFLKAKGKVGLLVCACGANEKRLREIAGKMDGEVVSVEKCKQAVESRGALKCENPGNCPGQAEKIMKLRKEGAEVLLISNCSDCTNTVMCVAPKLKMPVYHCTDHVMRAVGHHLIRRLPSNDI
ncbi:MAG: proline reductase-associated electron transfer protein PrdC [Clostridiaceae bacterium]|nr:proline reductase-associated electron transfer protein PrdC [Clostridiaceae bacterium]